MTDDKPKEVQIPLSAMLQAIGWIAGALWIISQQIRDVDYLKDSLTHEVGPSLIESAKYREEMTKRVDELYLIHRKDDEAVWREINNLKRRVEDLEDQLRQTKS